MKYSLHSNNQLSKNILNKIMEICLKNGIEFNPNIHIEIVSNNIRIINNNTTTNFNLFVPRKLFLKINDCLFSEKDKKIVIESIPLYYSSLQKDLLYLFIDLYNSMNKLENWKENHILKIFDQNPILKKLIYNSDLHLIKRYKQNNNFNYLSDFLFTRTFNYQDENKKISRNIIPIIDFLNNNFLGRKVNFNNDITLEIKNIGKDGECFFNYGPILDTIDYAILHGYLDNVTPYARLNSLVINLDNFCRVIINLKNDLPIKRIKDLVLPSVKIKEDSIEITNLVYVSGKKNNFKNYLKLLLKSFSKKNIDNDAMEKMVFFILERIYFHNKIYLNNIINSLKDNKNKRANILFLAAKRQLNIISELK